MNLNSNNRKRDFHKKLTNDSASQKNFSALKSCLNEVQHTWKKEGSLRALVQEWSNIAGLQLAANCSPISFHRGVVVIGASHPQWRQALLYNRPQLLAELRSAGYKVKSLKIQQHHPTELPKQQSVFNIWEKHPSRIDIHGMSECNKCGNPCPAGEKNLWGKCSFCKRQELNK